MKSLIYFELKRKLRSTMFVIAIILMLIAIVIDMENANALRDSRPFGNYPDSLTSNPYDWLGHESDKRKEAYPKAVDSFKLFSQIKKQAEMAAHEDNYIEYARLKSFNMLLTYKMAGVGNNKMSEATVKKEIGDLWDVVSNDIPYESVDFRPFTTLNSSALGSYLTISRFYETLYDNRLRIEYTDENTTASVVYRYLDGVLPVALLMFGIFFSYQSINKERKNGALKLLITQSIQRNKIYISKWISSVIQVMIALVIPILLTYIAVFIRTGNSGLRYPLPYLQGILSRVQPIINYSTTSVSGEPATIATRGIGHIATSVPMVNQWIFHSDIAFMSLARYAIAIFVLALIFTAFIVAFVQLISTVINNIQLSLVVTFAVYGVLTILSMPYTIGDHNNISPFTFFRSTRILEGIYNITPLTSIVILLISTGVLLVIGSQLFKRKAI